MIQNRPKEEVSEIAKKGGQSSHEGGFASMDPEKQVIFSLQPFQCTDLNNDGCYRRRSHPWVVRPRADHLKRAVRRLRKRGRKAGCLLEGAELIDGQGR